MDAMNKGSAENQLSWRQNGMIREPARHSALWQRQMEKPPDLPVVQKLNRECLKRKAVSRKPLVLRGIDDRNQREECGKNADQKI